jgi:hypothetical protein
LLRAGRVCCVAYYFQKDFDRAIADHDHASPSYRQLWGEGFEMTKLGERRIENNMTGYKVATSVGGLSTGERASEELFVKFSWRLTLR